MTLEKIYFEFIIGSDEFIDAIQIHCNFNITRYEIKRIARLSDTPKKFSREYYNLDF